jgi:hypothetical protein
VVAAAIIVITTTTITMAITMTTAITTTVAAWPATVVALSSSCAMPLLLLLLLQVFSWGLGTALGVGTPRSQWSPQEVEELSPAVTGAGDVVCVSCGGGYSAAVTANGSLYTWGKWSNGRLGASCGRSLCARSCHAETSCGNGMRALTWSQAWVSCRGRKRTCCPAVDQTPRSRFVAEVA